MTDQTREQPDGPRIVAFPSDAAVVEEFDLRRNGRPGETFILMFGEPALASLFRADPRVVASVAWLPEVARQVTALLPPRPRTTVAPPPIVIGDGRVACALVAALVEGSAEPGQPLEVHCLGGDPAWAHEAGISVEPQGQLSWSELAMRPLPVARRVRELVEAWQVPARKRGDPAGPAVLIALDDAAAAVSIAVTVESSVPKARVGVLLEGAGRWPAVPGVTVFDLVAMRRALVDAVGEPVTVLAEQLLAEVAWVSAPGSAVTRPVASVFAEAGYADNQEPLPWAEQPAELRDQVSVVAAALPRIMAAGSLEFADRVLGHEPVVLTPGELARMAAKILRVLGVAEDSGTRQTAVELAYLLPGIAGRAGQPVQRPAEYAPLLTFADIERLAPLVHLAYQNVSVATNNATGSPLAGALWHQLTEFDRAGNRAVLAGAAVCHAVLGLDWRALGDESAELVLDDDRIERLAELEHRRWATYQRRNGAGDHKWMKPWNGPEDEAVTEEAKMYDRLIVRNVIGFLRGANIEVVEV